MPKSAVFAVVFVALCGNLLMAAEKKAVHRDSQKANSKTGTTQMNRGER
jgi:hypothetical protein